MAIEHSTMTDNSIADRWWVPLIRGIAAILFGVLVLVYPAISLMVLVMLWGSYALIDGVFSLVMAVRRGRGGGRWGWWAAEGIVGIVAGIVAFAWPGMTGLILLMVIAAWAVLTGITSIVTAVRLRKVITDEWLLGASGVLSIIFGLLLFAYPSTGALALLGIIAGYSIVFGVLLLGLAWRLYSWHRRSAGRPAMPTGTSSGTTSGMSSAMP
jgi:uncharacterized membrane protein HdeD (DUF308 family)